MQVQAGIPRNSHRTLFTWNCGLSSCSIFGTSSKCSGTNFSSLQTAAQTNRQLRDMRGNLPTTWVSCPLVGERERRPQVPEKHCILHRPLPKTRSLSTKAASLPALYALSLSQPSLSCSYCQLQCTAYRTHFSLKKSDSIGLSSFAKFKPGRQHRDTP